MFFLVDLNPEVGWLLLDPNLISDVTVKKMCETSVAGSEIARVLTEFLWYLGTQH